MPSNRTASSSSRASARRTSNRTNGTANGTANGTTNGATSVSGANGKVPRLYHEITFGSVKSVAKSLKGRRLAAKSLGSMLDAAHAESQTRLVQLATGIVSQRRGAREEREAIRSLVGWAARPGSGADERRRGLVKAYRGAGRSVFLVHGMSELPRADAAALMRSYFAEGGDMKDVADWLAAAGAELARRTTPGIVPDIVGGVVVPRVARPRAVTPRSRPKFGWDDITGVVSDIGGALSGAISTVADAVAAAAKDLASAVAAAASWTLSKTTDLVRGLIAAGKSVASILGKALAEGAAVLRKFVRAVIAAGRSIGEVLAWAAQKVAGTIRDAVVALLEAGRTAYQILSWAAGQIAATAEKIVRALRDAAQTVAQIMKEVVRFAAATIRKLVAAVWAVIRDAGQILAGVAATALSVIRTVLEGLFMCGVTLVQNVAGICLGVVEQFRKGFMEGLIALGHLPLDILKAAAMSSLAVVGLAFAALLELWGGHRPLTAEEKAEARKVFGWSIALDRVKVAVASIPADIANWANGERPFTTMYVINFASWAHIDMRTLIHELTHVWQAVVAGPVYMVEALHSQMFGRGYDVTAEDLANANGDIRKLEREQQAVVVERYWAGRWGGSGEDWTPYKPLADDVYRERITIPATQLLPGMLPLPRGGRRRGMPKAKRFTVQALA